VERLSSAIQTGSAAHPASYTNVRVFFFWGKSGQGVALTTHPHLAPRLKKEYSYTFTPLLGLLGLF
jgi:hypothetical protein